MATEEKLDRISASRAKMTIDIEFARRLKDDLLRYRRESLRQAQRALEISKLLDLIIEPTSRD